MTKKLEKIAWERMQNYSKLFITNIKYQFINIIYLLFNYCFISYWRYLFHAIYQFCDILVAIFWTREYVIFCRCFHGSQNIHIYSYFKGTRQIKPTFHGLCTCVNPQYIQMPSWTLQHKTFFIKNIYFVYSSKIYYQMYCTQIYFTHVSTNERSEM